VDVIVALLFTAAVVLALLEAFGVGRRVNLGWLAVACLAAGFALPALDVAVVIT
jgi:hypothetical protein